MKSWRLVKDRGRYPEARGRDGIGHVDDPNDLSDLD